ncbi:MAG: hypothetical protein CMH66_04315 [Nioella sp.]|nr:hypothetical protein [Nioella sp.]
MNKLWYTAAAVVLTVAAIKTVLVSLLFLTPEQRDLVTLSGLFAGFAVLTACVAHITFIRIKAHFDGQRRSRATLGADDPASKEVILQHYAAEWGLSQAEAEVALFVVKGFSNGEIAEMRGCAVATVKSQLGKIYQKSGLETRYQLIGYVTDEVCAVAQEAGQAAPQPSVRPLFKLGEMKALAGKSGSAAAANLMPEQRATAGGR